MSHSSINKADRVVRDFTSFDEDSERILKLISQLHTSRVSGYGFTAEADVLGVEYYAINEQLDNRICPVCEAMHGRKFEVQAARRLYDDILFEDNPERIKALQPWPSQKKDNVKIMQLMSQDELIMQGWHVPPFHPWCRGLLVHIDDVPNLKEPPAPDEISHNHRLGRNVTVEDIHALEKNNFGFEIKMMGDGEKVVRMWNDIFGDLNPQTLYDSLNDGFKGLLGTNGGHMRLLPGEGADRSQLNLRMGVFQGQESPRDAISLERIFTKSVAPTAGGGLRDAIRVEHEYFKIHSSLQRAGLGKSYMNETMKLYQEIGVSRVSMQANIDVGSYAWAKYGFTPRHNIVASSLAEDLRNRLRGITRDSKMSGLLAEAEVDAVLLLFKKLKTDPSVIHEIASLGKMIEGETLGFRLLSNQNWLARLNLADEAAMSTFWDYVS
jgi:GNAT superfamily N-acetyltransferase